MLLYPFEEALRSSVPGLVSLWWLIHTWSCQSGTDRHYWYHNLRMLQVTLGQDKSLGRMKPVSLIFSSLIGPAVLLASLLSSTLYFILSLVRVTKEAPCWWILLNRLQSQRILFHQIDRSSLYRHDIKDINIIDCCFCNPDEGWNRISEVKHSLLLPISSTFGILSKCITMF